MSRLMHRVERLEGPVADDGAIAWVRAPAHWPDERGRAEAEALAVRRGLRPPFSVAVRPDPGARTVQPVFVGTGADLGALLADIAARGARIGGKSR